MKTKYLLLFILLICSLTSKAEEKTVTFKASEDRTSEAAISKEGITITAVTRIGNPGAEFDEYSSSTTNPGYYYKIASGASMYISSNVGYITNIIITYRPKGTVNGFKLESDQGTYKENKPTNATWNKGKANSLSFYSSDTNHISSISVTYDRSITMSSSTYATFWCEKAYTMPTGLTGYTISDVTDGKVVYGMTFEAGSMVPAKTPLLLRGNAGTYAYTTSDDNTAAPPPNLLQCATGTEVSSKDTYYYKVSYRSSKDKTIGFFWDAEDGYSVNIDYGKAFMAVPAPVAAGAKGFVFDNIANGIDMMPIDDAMDGQPKAGEWIYDTNGRAYRYSSSINKGIYITKGGRKIVIH